ncbi:MAG: arginase, partial [Firmicutes bacterium]|nr:arginase [Bacillota bacterium]
FELKKMLFDEYDVEVELADYRNVLAIVTYANEPEEIDKLVNAMADISDRFSDEGEPLPPGEKLPPQPDYVLSPRAAYFNERERVPWVETRGRIVAEMIAPYPPGIPVIYQGERMSAEVWDYIEAFRQRNGHIHGPSDPTLSTLMVIKE